MGNELHEKIDTTLWMSELREIAAMDNKLTRSCRLLAFPNERNEMSKADDNTAVMGAIWSPNPFQRVAAAIQRREGGGILGFRPVSRAREFITGKWRLTEWKGQTAQVSGW